MLYGLREVTDYDRPHDNRQLNLIIKATKSLILRLDMYIKKLSTPYPIDK